MNNVQLNTVGKVIGGDDIGTYVKVVDDTEVTGGFLIVTSKELDFSTGFDDWVESLDDLESYFIEARWIIDWMKPI